MGSCQFLEHRNQVRDSCSFSGRSRHGCSKAQLSLHKILNTIKFCPPAIANQTSISCLDETRELESNHSGSDCTKRGFGIDLNLSLGFLSETEEESEPFSVYNNECAEPSGLGLATVGEEKTVVAAVTDLPQAESSEILGNGVDDEKGKGRKPEEEDKLEVGDTDNEVKTVSGQGDRDNSRDCLALLVEAAELCLGESVDNECDSEKPSGDNGLNPESETVNNKRSRGNTESNKNDEIPVPYEQSEDTSPVVRSKRGRRQTLPYRYRDSVLLEPWNELPRLQRPRTKVAPPKQGARLKKNVNN